jgi:F0F1-type ATP synthase assembly protein I
MASERPDQRAKTDELGIVGVASGLGCSIVVTLVLFIVAGGFLDRWLGTSPVFLFFGVGVGFIAAGYQFYELAMLANRGKQAGPVTRTLKRTLSSRRDPKDQSR